MVIAIKKFGFLVYCRILTVWNVTPFLYPPYLTLSLWFVAYSSPLPSPIFPPSLFTKLAFESHVLKLSPPLISSLYSLLIHLSTAFLCCRLRGKDPPLDFLCYLNLSSSFVLSQYFSNTWLYKEDRTTLFGVWSLGIHILPLQHCRHVFQWHPGQM